MIRKRFANKTPMMFGGFPMFGKRGVKPPITPMMFGGFPVFRRRAINNTPQQPTDNTPQQPTPEANLKLTYQPIDYTPASQRGGFFGRINRSLHRHAKQRAENIRQNPFPLRHFHTNNTPQPPMLGVPHIMVLLSPNAFPFLFRGGR